MTEFTAKSVKISDIKIVDTRNKMEDIDPLADNIKKYGLLYPIHVDENYNLMDGNPAPSLYTWCSHLILAIRGDING